MAISTNPLLLAFSGSIGNQLTIKNYNGKIVVCKKIDVRTKKTTKAQKANESFFSRTNKMAKAVYADPEKREQARLRLSMPSGNALYRAILREVMEEEKKRCKK